MIVIKLVTMRGDLFHGFMHAANNHVSRRRLWNKMLQFGSCNICFMGDFNAIIGEEEQVGQRCLSRISCDEFRQCISDSRLVDLETTGPFITWRCSHSSRILLSRLDRALASEAFLGYWASVSAMVLPRTSSDHHPILLKWKENLPEAMKPFRFQSFWVSHKEFKAVVSDSWCPFISTKDPITVCICKLKRLKARLKDWSKGAFGDIFVKLDGLQRELLLLQQRDVNSIHEVDHMQRESVLMKEIQVTLEQQQLLLRQKSRTHWLVDGDRITAFFNRVLRAARAKASINSMMINGELCEDVGVISEHIQGFYKELFNDNGGNIEHLSYIRELLTTGSRGSRIMSWFARPLRRRLKRLCLICLL